MSDPSTDKSAVLLEGILQTLKQINDNLSLQERRWDSLAEVLGNSSTLPSRSGELRTAWPPLSSLTITPKDENMFDHRKPVGTQKLPSSETPYHNLGVPHFPPFKAGKEADSMTDYRSWRSPLENSPLHQHSFLTEQLGDAWTIPDDGRLPLSFSREVLESLGPDQLRLAVSYIGKFRDRMARSKEQRFHVIDYDGVGGNIAYRLGQPIVRGAQELKPISNTKTTVDAPWRRFVLCQGLNTAQEDDHDSYERRLAAGCWDQAPFLLHHDRCNTRSYLMTTIERHIRCWERDHSHPNTYGTAWEAFHITFYEAPSVFAPEATRNLPRGSWQYGPLYGSKELDLCESALTLIAIPSTSNRPPKPPAYELGRTHDRLIVQDHPCSEWSIILLAPLDFFIESAYHNYPLRKDSFQGRIGEKSMEEATIYLLRATYSRLYYNWRLFKTHFDALLNEGNEEIALFRPALHDELLQDDERFSRSRRYAWAIKCLTNFESSISNNILQWKNFKSARLDHLHKAGTLSMLSRTSLNDIDQMCIRLEGLHKYFSMKLASTKALRDGLFNASTVIESRASTRLAKNIRLLTFVSIFFQPLTFCTSLWSVNNTFSSTALIYTSIVVGLSTYIIVFHLNSLVYRTSSAYTPIRDKIISRMKSDSDEHWSNKGKQFATFQPKHEKLRPSEWWILLFGAQNLFTSIYCFLLRKPAPVNTATGPSPAIIVISDDDGAVSKGAETGTHTREEASSTTPALSPSNDSNQPPTTEAQSREDSQRSFHFQMRFLKKHNPSPRPSSADPPTHEEV